VSAVITRQQVTELAINYLVAERLDNECARIETSFCGIKVAMRRLR
jgi:hypothetical protein